MGNTTAGVGESTGTEGQQQGTEGQQTGTEGQQQGTEGQQQGTETTSKGEGSEPPAKEETPEQKLSRLEKENADLRKEHQRTRLSAKDKAAQEARDAQIQEIGKLLGFVKGDEETNPETLQRQLAEFQSQAKDRERELVVYRSSSKHGADPDRLLDSRRFMDSIKDIEPGDDNAVEAAIKAAVDADATLKTAKGSIPGASSANHSGGTGEKREVKDLPLADALKVELGNHS